MISVAMSTFNSKLYIIEQLDSIKNQTVKVDEVVIVDDCSTDETVKIVNDYIKKNKLCGWMVHQHINNRGYIETFTDAMRYCHGDIIILSDHDDIWLPTKVEIISNAFKNNNKILALNTSFIQIDAVGQTVNIKQKRKHANNNLIRRSVVKGDLNKMGLYDVAIYNISPGCTCAIKKSLRDIYLETSLNLPHDWKLNILAACSDGLYYLDVPTTKYRIYDKNTIGLGHQIEYQKRMKIVRLNYNEKCAAVSLLEKYKDLSSKELSYYIQIKDLFKKRVECLEKGNIFIYLSLIFSSLKFGTLYESVILDLVSKITDKGR